MQKKQNLMRPPSRRDFLKGGLSMSIYAGLWGGFGLTGCGVRRGHNKPNIILITLDTTRADRLSCYGHARKTSPNLDKVARESVLYTQAIAPSSWTLPSHASLFTGKFTSSHGARYDAAGPLRLADAISEMDTLGPFRVRGLAMHELTLADILNQEGYATGAVVAGPWMKKEFGLNKGFDYYDDDEITHVDGRRARQVTERAEEWIQKPRKEKFFLFLNYFDPHGPYAAPEGFAKSFLPKNTRLSGRETTLEERKALYDAEILYMDHYIGRLFQRLKDLRLYDDTWIIVTADHGELFGEHGKFGHGHYLYQQELHVPLFMKYPAGEAAPARTDVKIQLNDILAVICQRLDIALPHNIQSSVPPQIKHPVIAETYPLKSESKDGDWRAIFEGDFKFIWSSKGEHLLFNLKEDPREIDNLAAWDRERVERMTAKLDAYLAGLPKPGRAKPAQELDAETKAALKSLGYLE